jgi:hypothetical protein
MMSLWLLAIPAAMIVWQAIIGPQQSDANCEREG